MFNDTFCTNCDETLCSCSHPNEVPRYEIINNEIYIINEL